MLFVTTVVNTGYRKSTIGDSTRVVGSMRKDEADAVDSWGGIPAGMPSRTSAIRFLLKTGFETVKAQEYRQFVG